MLQKSINNTLNHKMVARTQNPSTWSSREKVSDLLNIDSYSDHLWALERSKTIIIPAQSHSVSLESPMDPTLEFWTVGGNWKPQKSHTIMRRTCKLQRLPALDLPSDQPCRMSKAELWEDKHGCELQEEPGRPQLRSH